MARPPTKKPVVEVYRRRAAPDDAPPVVKPADAFAESATTLPATPVAKASALPAGEPPPLAARFGPYLPGPRRFAREPVDVAALPPVGKAVHLPELGSAPDEELAGAIARALNETASAPCELIRRIGAKYGPQFLRARYAKAREIEARGGRMLKKLQRRRTPGGCFFAECERRMPAGSFATLASLSALAVGLTPSPSYPPPADPDDAPQSPRPLKPA